MKNSLAVLFFLLSISLFGQQFGISGHFVMMIPKFENEARLFNPKYSDHLQHRKQYCPGIRLEGNYLLKDHHFPTSAYNGFSLTYFIPILDSSSYYLKYADKSGWYYMKKGFQRNSMLNTVVRFGYEIPQGFNEFLSLHMGWGAGLLAARSVYQLPDLTGQFQYKNSDFTNDSFKPIYHLAANVEAFGGFVYEFDRYSTVIQYTFSYGFKDFKQGSSALLDCHIRHEISIGLLYEIN